ncbi:uncharacterized protein [Dermacentor andersoni]|uniref:uncharacterized protein n=1 Tax=Dermacentor andersoni TaxID=34620 RepID=UPI002154F80E|nr:putative surface-exposed virulence protein BigA [Dermacentor andersoni]
MGCANAKAAGVPTSGKTDYPLEVTDGSDRTNLINNPVPKVVINGGDFLDNEHHVNGTADAEDKANGNTDPPGTETFLPPPDTPQEVEFLAPPDPPRDDKDDREAVADRTGDTPLDDGNHVTDNDNAADDNGNRLPPNGLTREDTMPDAVDGVVTDDASEVGVVVADDNANDVTPGNDVTTDGGSDVVRDAGDRTSPDVTSDAPNGENDAPRDLIENSDIAPNDIFVDDGLDLDTKKADRKNSAHDFIVRDA